MPKKNEVKGLFSQGLAGGRIRYYWKPTPRERSEGWRTLTLGSDPAVAAQHAAERNREVGGEFRALSREPGGGRGSIGRIRRRITRMEQHQRWVERTLLRLHEQLEEAKGRKSKVYFIATLKGPIKIGVSFDPEARVRAIQTGHSKQLRILAVTDGGYELEAEYHRRFAAHRLRGEWFVAHEELLEEIRRLKAGHPPLSSNGVEWRRMALSEAGASI